MDKQQYLNALRQAWAGCHACRLCETRRQIVFGYGNPDSQVMIIGEAPGENEDKSGLPFIGAAGMLLDQYLGVCSVRDEVIEAYTNITSQKRSPEAQRNEWRARLRELLIEEFYFCNVVMCHPENNRDPTATEIAACRPRLLEQIYTIDPVFIIAAGKIAATALIGRNLSITAVRGEIFDVEFEGKATTYRYPVMPVLHPAYLLRKNDFRQAGGDTQKTRDDFLRVMHLVDEYNWRHYGIQKPRNRPPIGKR